MGNLSWTKSLACVCPVGLCVFKGDGVQFGQIDARGGHVKMLNLLVSLRPLARREAENLAEKE
jgi:hypothetical protein